MEALVDTPANMNTTIERSELETLGLELALRDREALEADFGGCVCSALETVKGTLLFQFEIAAEAESRKLAAVSVGHGESRSFALIVLPEGQDGVRVERVEDSAEPLAVIAPSYASLIDVLDVAA